MRSYILEKKTNARDLRVMSSRYVVSVETIDCFKRRLDKFMDDEDRW